VTAAVFGARTMAQLTENLGAADLTLGEEATATLDAVSAPTAGGYPYGVLGAWQRGRWLQQDGTPAPPPPSQSAPIIRLDASDSRTRSTTAVCGRPEST